MRATANKFISFFIVLITTLCTLGSKNISISAAVSPINIAYNNNDLELQWTIDRDSLQKDPNNNRMSVQNFSRYGSTNVFFLTQHYHANTYLYRCTDVH